MDQLVQFGTADDTHIVVAVADEDLPGGARLAARGGDPVQATRTFENSLESARAAAESALRVFRDGRLKPDAVEIEFGVKLTAEAGAVIAKSAVEGHLVVKLSWAPQQAPAPAPAPTPEPTAQVPAPAPEPTAQVPAPTPEPTAQVPAPTPGADATA